MVKSTISYDKISGLWIPHIDLQLFASNIYYIDYATGADSNNGTSTSTPLKHCPGDPNYSPSGPAPTTLLAGDTVIFKGGISYLSFPVCNWSGSSGNLITYDGNSAGTWGTGKAIIDGQNSRKESFQVNGQDYITILNFKLTNLAWYNGWESGLWSTAGSNYITLQDCFITDSNAKGVYFRNATNVLIKDCEISYHDNQSGYNNKVVTFHSSSDLIFEGNYIHDNGVGLELHQDTNIKIRYNHFFRQDIPLPAHADQFQIADSTGVEVYCNMFEAGPANIQSLSFTFGEDVSGTEAEVWSNVIIGVGTHLISRNGVNLPTSHIKAYNNSFYGNSVRATRITEGSILDFKNNAVYCTSEVVFDLLMSNAMDSPYTGDFNYYYDPISPRWLWEPTFCTTYSEWVNLSGEGADSAFVDPEYNNPASPDNDLSLKSTSPCIGAGIDLSGVNVKYAEALVPGCTFPNPETTTRTGLWDIGAYVYEESGNGNKLAFVLKS